MKGSSCNIALRIRVVTLFAAAFVSGAILIFAVSALAGSVLRGMGLPLEWRVSFAAASLIGLAFVDILSIRQDRYCPLGWRRQTPKSLGRRYPPATVAAAWGFDTGLAVTTFRVAAVTWGALVMAGLGLSNWWTGVGYGLGFSIPLLLSIAMQASDPPSDLQTSLGSRLEALLRKRAVIQLASAVLLFSAGAVLLVSLFLG